MEKFCKCPEITSNPNSGIIPKALPEFASLMLWNLEALKRIGQPASGNQLDHNIFFHQDFMGKAQVIHSTDRSEQNLAHYLKWSRVYLKRGGAITKQAPDHFSLTVFGTAKFTIEQTRTLHKYINNKGHWWSDNFDCIEILNC